MEYSVVILNVKNRQDIPAFYKNASTEDKDAYKQVQDIMQTIYNENPSYWPYGLQIAGHDSVYAIRDNATEKIAGFVGWQEHLDDEGNRVGSYSIGILPEYRNRGFAKEAVAKVIKEKVAGVDKVISYIVTGNKASDGLANSLNIDTIHEF